MTFGGRNLRKSPRAARSPHRQKRRSLIRQISNEAALTEGSKANVRVVVRVRPPNEQEQANNFRNVVKVVDDHMLIFDPKEDEDDFFFQGMKQKCRDMSKRQPKEQKFWFEKVFNEDSTNHDVFEDTTKKIVNTLLDGYNCSVFAYGATGAGKTFTMLGKPHMPGITFLTVMELYRCIEEQKEQKLCEVGVSYLEVYNETVRDLLSPGGVLNVQEAGNQVRIPGLTFHKPTGAEDLMETLARGNKNRSQHPTDANAESSRSHAVFQVFVKQQDRIADIKGNITIAKLSMIDLAGSERGAVTGFKGSRFREGANINKSLLALGNCINALADGQRHIPYRDSKLTRLLKDSIGGSCCSVMIANVSPAISSFEDTFNTLRYANRAKTIKTSLKKNTLNVDHHVSQYMKIIENLRQEIISLKEKIKECEENQDDFAQERLRDYEERIEELEQQAQQNSATHQFKVDEADESIKIEADSVFTEKIALKKKFLQQEAYERDVELKLCYAKLRLARLKVMVFASSKLGKCADKCERTVQKLEEQLDHIRVNKESLKSQLVQNSIKETTLEERLGSCNTGKSFVCAKDHVTQKKLETSVHEFNHVQHYMSDILEKNFSEMATADKLIGVLLHATKDLYLQLKMKNESTPEADETIKAVINCMDESRIAWADQMATAEPAKAEDCSGLVQPCIPNVSHITSFSYEPLYGISPVQPINEKKIFRPSIIRNGKSSVTLPEAQAPMVQQELQVSNTAVFKEKEVHSVMETFISRSSSSSEDEFAQFSSENKCAQSSSEDTSNSDRNNVLPKNELVLSQTSSEPTSSMKDGISLSSTNSQSNHPNYLWTGSMKFVSMSDKSPRSCDPEFTAEFQSLNNKSEKRALNETIDIQPSKLNTTVDPIGEGLECQERQVFTHTPSSCMNETIVIEPKEPELSVCNGGAQRQLFRTDNLNGTFSLSDSEKAIHISPEPEDENKSPVLGANGVRNTLGLAEKRKVLTPVDAKNNVLNVPVPGVQGNERDVKLTYLKPFPKKVGFSSAKSPFKLSRSTTKTPVKLRRSASTTCLPSPSGFDGRQSYSASKKKIGFGSTFKSKVFSNSKHKNGDEENRIPLSGASGFRGGLTKSTYSLHVRESAIFRSSSNLHRP
ncbi:kinesin-like protein KIF18A [Oratosquilla oratoria]|uniref:kinesin-like protein KIF18A n=1 Tax=Oratosquilla oratoria TaxID=337810 RepID=UPI003F77700D